MIVTIDGPVASGKSTVAQKLAERFGFYYLYTGLLYRALAYALVTSFEYTKKTLEEPAQEDIDVLLAKGRIVYTYDAQGPHIFFDSVEITHLLKSEFVDSISSISSANARVRHAVFLLQQSVAVENNIVADGRDTGTVVFPLAEAKFFLTASLSERARRWRIGQMRQGNSVSEEEARAAVALRDERDTLRVISPLKKAEDAILVDNTDLTIDETVAFMERVVAVCVAKETKHPEL